MVGMLGVLGLLRILQILERHGRQLEVDDAGFAVRQFLALFVADVDGAENRAAHRAGMRQPLVG